MDAQVVIVGGGPAAHSAALVLGRARKRVLVCDEGRPANRVAKHSHSFLTRDGTPPFELRRIAVEQLRSYESVQCFSDTVTEIDRLPSGFRVSFEKRSPATARFVLLALGMPVEIPSIVGFEELWGDSVIHCPYCHGWEVRDLPWAVNLSDVEKPIDPRRLRSWSKDVVVIADDALSISPSTLESWTAAGLKLERGSIHSLHLTDGKLESIELTGGRRIPRSVLLYAPPRRQAGIVAPLGLELDEDGCVKTDAAGLTSSEGIYAAGDMTTLRHQIVFAAASGAATAMAIDAALALAGEVYD